MSDNGFIRLDRLKTALSQVKTKVDSDIASAISESTISLTSLINSGDASILSEAKGYADGLKIIIDSNISSGDSSTLTSANSYTDSKISSVNLTINDLNESIPGQINLALENYTEYSDFSDHVSNTNNPHNVTAVQVGAAEISHTHSESDITDLGNYSVAGHTHTVNDITDSDTLATNLNLTAHTSNTNNPHAVTKTQVGLSNVDNTSDLDKPISTAVQTALNDLKDRIDAVDEIGSSITLASLGGASATDLTNHISDTNNPHNVTYSQTGAAAASHTHTEADITDLGDYASSSHTHTLSNITDVTATASEVNTLDGITATTAELNNIVNSTSNIQMQLNDARLYGFFPKWEDNHEYNVEDCVKIPCCTTTQYLECMVAGVSGLSPDYTSNRIINYYILDGNLNSEARYDIYFSMDELESVSNGQCFVDGTCVWIVQDIRDTRPIGSITPLLWRPLTTYNAFENYGIGITNETTYYDGSSNKIYDLETPNYLCFIRLIKRIIGSAIFTVDNDNDRFFNLTGSRSIDEASSKYLSHLGTALVVLDWCFNPFNYLRSDKINTIDSKAYNYINHILNNYNTTYGVNLTENQIKTTAITIKNKIKSNNVSDDIIYLKNNKLGNHPYLAMGNYGVYINAGLPNISETLGYIVSKGMSTTERTTYTSTNRALRFRDTTSNYEKMTTNTGNSSSHGAANIVLNLGAKNSIYGNSTTVTPNSIAVYYYMKF